MPVQSLVPDSVSEEQIAALVDTFYARVRQDETLGPVFEQVVGDAWEPHLAKMRAFWSSLVLASGRYKGNPMIAHLKLLPRIGEHHFERWLSLWRQTTAELFPQHVAENFVWRAENMAERVLGMIDHHHAQLANQQS